VQLNPQDSQDHFHQAIGKEETESRMEDGSGQQGKTFD